MKKDPNNMTLLEHLEELRLRIIYVTIVLGILALITFHYSLQILQFIMEPLLKVLPKTSHVIFTGITEAFWVRMEVSLYAALLFGLPYVFYHIWMFVNPGLTKKEKKVVLPFVLFATIFFLLGCLFAYKVILPIGLKFLVSYGGAEISAMPSIKQYVSFFLRICFAFGLIFEMPVLSFILAKADIIDAKWLIKKWDYAILAAFIVAAILAPPDVLSQFLMAIPMILLYVVSIGVVYLAQKPKNEEED
ncbi:twin-arginine translocase subunit TatC [Desulfurella sp.]|uniref:twin-arginine translocase subunit TatC n=1 Tax=Desulfurella sp. TaxID=1962857 RepID=UPI0025C0A92D|nr:twin-arginine translocase subunit TatC [Desulfurella sp.]